MLYKLSSWYGIRYDLLTDWLTDLLTYLLIYLLTYYRSQSPLEKLTDSQLVNKFPAFCGTRKFIILYYVMLCYVCYVFYIILYYIILYYVMLYYIILYYIILYYIILLCKLCKSSDGNYKVYIKLYKNIGLVITWPVIMWKLCIKGLILCTYRAFCV